MKIKLLMDQRWSVGFFKKDTILEVGTDVSEKIGKAMLLHGYAEELGAKSQPSPVVENKAVQPVVEDKKEVDKELIEKINSMTKKELLKFASKNKIELDKEDNLKSEILNKVLKFVKGGNLDED